MAIRKPNEQQNMLDMALSEVWIADNKEKGLTYDCVARLVLTERIGFNGGYYNAVINNISTFQHEQKEVVEVWISGFNRKIV